MLGQHGFSGSDIEQNFCSI